MDDGNKQTDKANPDGTATDKPVENTDKTLSLYDKTEAVVTRQEEANKKSEEILDRQETLHANQRLAGTSGGHVTPTPAPEISNIEYANKLKRGEVNPLAEDGISIN